MKQGGTTGTKTKRRQMTFIKNEQQEQEKNVREDGERGEEGAKIKINK